MFYAQEIEQVRPDIKVVDINLLRRSWYFDYLKHAYPGLIERSREKIDVFVENLKEWEHDPGFCQESGADSKNQRCIFRDDSINGDQ